jgi:transposase
MFMLATNDLSDTLTMEKMLSLYKSQQSVEKGFRFLKSPDFLTSSLYLKKPDFSHQQHLGSHQCIYCS